MRAVIASSWSAVSWVGAGSAGPNSTCSLSLTYNVYTLNNGTVVKNGVTYDNLADALEVAGLQE